MIDGMAQVIAAVGLGFAVAMGTVLWLIGGDVSSLRWAWGSIGEQQTAKVLERLDGTWTVGHDIPNGHGNWDHVVVGSAGVFMLESKRFLSGRPIVARDELREGHLRLPGGHDWGRRGWTNFIGRFVAYPPRRTPHLSEL